MERIRLLIADDHPLIRAGLAAVLVQQADLELVAGAENGAGAVALYRKHRSDVGLMDLRMPGMGGAEAIRTITTEFPEARLLALTTKPPRSISRASSPSWMWTTGPKPSPWRCPAG